MAVASLSTYKSLSAFGNGNILKVVDVLLLKTAASIGPVWSRHLGVLSVDDTIEENALGWKPIEDSSMKCLLPFDEAAALSSDSVKILSYLPSRLMETISAIVDGIVKFGPIRKTETLESVTVPAVLT